MSAGLVYMLNIDGETKIGMTRKPLRERMNGYKRTAIIERTWECEDAYECEQRLITRLHRHLVRGREWFHLPARMHAWLSACECIETQARTWDMSRWWL